MTSNSDRKETLAAFERSDWERAASGFETILRDQPDHVEYLTELMKIGAAPFR